MSTHVQKLAARQQIEVLPLGNKLPLEAGGFATEALSRLLVEILDVALCVRHAHWNARGPDLLPKQDLLEEVGESLDRQADRVAIRIRALGGVAPGTAQCIITQSSMKPYPVEVTEGQDHMEAVAQRLGLLSAEARLSIYDSKGLGDPVTVRIMGDVNAAIDHALWHIEGRLLSSK